MIIKYNQISVNLLSQHIAGCVLDNLFIVTQIYSMFMFIRGCQKGINENKDDID